MKISKLIAQKGKNLSNPSTKRKQQVQNFGNDNVILSEESTSATLNLAGHSKKSQHRYDNHHMPKRPTEYAAIGLQKTVQA